LDRVDLVRPFNSVEVGLAKVVTVRGDSQLVRIARPLWETMDARYRGNDLTGDTDA
jgi:hypothetical protein